MIYDVTAIVKAKDEKSEDKCLMYLASAASASHLNLLLDKHLPKGAEIYNIQVNPEIEQVHIINPKGTKIIKVITENPENKCDDCEGCELIEVCDRSEYTETYCIANTINEVLARTSELGYDGNLMEITVFTDGITYIY